MNQESYKQWIGRACLPVLFLVCALPALAVDRAAVEGALSHPNLRGAQVSVEIRDLVTDEIVFARQAHTPLIVASNTKLVTTASALHHLGDEFQFETRLYARGRIAGSLLEGDLILRGGGDPSLSERIYEADPLAPLDRLAAAVAKAGIQRVQGALLLDDSLFDREFVAPGWPADQLNRSYCAPVSALSVMENLVWLETRPGPSVGSPARVILSPPGVPFTLSGQIRTTSRKKDHIIHIGRPQSDGRITVSGRFYQGNASSRYSVAVRNPPEYFGCLLLGALARAGVTVDQDCRCLDRAPDYEEQHVQLLERITSDVTQAVIVTNKKSVNHYSEQLFKLTGWQVTGKGTFSAGEAAVRQLFRDLKVMDIDPIQMVDGSGLSRENRFSAHTMTALLDVAYDAGFRDTYLRSLPIAGVDGTLAKRMDQEPYRSRVRAKTGWINGVSALSGYAQSLDGKVYAFSILFNDYKGGNSTMKSLQDRICKAIVDG